MNGSGKPSNSFKVKHKNKYSSLLLSRKKLRAPKNFNSLMTAIIISGSIALGIVLLFIALGQSQSLEEEKTLANLDTLLCKSSHESYNITNDSILGNYTKFSVAVDNARCSKIGKEILLRNGSVVDAAIASGLCNGVLNSQSAGIGGGFFMVVYLKSKNKTFTIDAREKAPAKAHKLMFLDKTSAHGGLSTAIPGEIHGYWEAWKLGGHLPWQDLFQPVINLCKNGFRVSKILARAILMTESFIRKDVNGLAEIFINKETNQTYQHNDIIKMEKLAKTFELIRDYNITVFSNTNLTKLMVEEINENGGNVTLSDFSSYRALVKEPIINTIDHDYRLITSPLPSSGILVSFILKVMRGFNITKQTLENEYDSFMYHHRLVESFKHAFAHRSLLGDEVIYNRRVSEILKNLTDSNYINSIRKKIVDFKTFPTSHYGEASFKEDHGTAHISVLAHGDAVSLTSSINSYFGGKYAGKNTGIIYNNQMDDFSTPNLVNLYNLQPSETNFIRSGKRPMSSMSPIIIIDKHDNVRLVLGASGGTKIITAVSQVAIKNLWLGKNIKEAIDHKRLHHQLMPEHVQFESFFDFSVQKFLKQIGHKMDCFDSGGSIIQGISSLVESKRILANCDARKGGSPDGL